MDLKIKKDRVPDYIFRKWRSNFEYQSQAQTRGFCSFSCKNAYLHIFISKLIGSANFLVIFIIILVWKCSSIQMCTYGLQNIYLSQHIFQLSVCLYSCMFILMYVCLCFLFCHLAYKKSYGLNSMVKACQLVTLSGLIQRLIDSPMIIQY